MPNVTGNPFPGVNPFVEEEAYWSDFHGTFLTFLKTSLLALLPDTYDVRVEEHIVTSEIGEDALITRRRPRRSDVAIVERGDASEAFPSATSHVAVADPVAVADVVELELVDFEQDRVHSLAIRRIGDDELITSIELLSPANKVGDGYDDFAAKRRELFAAGINTVDLDLLRRGQRLAFNSPLPTGDFYAFVATPARSRRAACYRWTLRDRLPAIRIPLAAGDPDLVVDLVKPYDDAFTLGGYPRRLRYARPLAGVDAATAAWARSLVDAASVAR